MRSADSPASPPPDDDLAGMVFPATFQQVIDFVNGGDDARESLADYLGRVTDRLPPVIDSGTR